MAVKSFYVPSRAKSAHTSFKSGSYMELQTYQKRYDHETRFSSVLSEILTTGEDHLVDRTGVGRRKIFDKQLRFDISTHFPMVTQRQVSFSAIVSELLWIISGSTNINDMPQGFGKRIWGKWATEDGSIGPMYGANMRAFKAVGPNDQIVVLDQIDRVIHKLRNNPESTRHRLTTMNLGFEPDESISPQDNVKAGLGALTPCHGLFIQLHVLNPLPGKTKRRLSMNMMQASCDFAVGGAFNMPSYALLLRMIAQCVDMEPFQLTWNIGDCHIYMNQIEKIKLQLSRPIHAAPTLEMEPTIKNINDFNMDHFSLNDYNHNESIIYEVAK